MKYFNIKKIILIFSILVIITDFVFAKNFGEAVKGFTNGILHTATTVALIFTFSFFLWRLFVYMLVLAQDPSSEKVKDSKKWLIYAIIILFVFVSIFALVSMVKKSLKLDESQKIDINIRTHENVSKPWLIK